MTDYQSHAYNVNAAIEMLQNVDGETMEEIIRGVGMEDQMLRQLIMTMPLETIYELLEERGLLELGEADDDDDKIELYPKLLIQNHEKEKTSNYN